MTTHSERKKAEKAWGTYATDDRFTTKPMSIAGMYLTLEMKDVDHAIELLKSHIVKNHSVILGESIGNYYEEVLDILERIKIEES